MPDTHPAATLWSRRALPNHWDILALVLILGGAALLALGMRQAAVPVAALDAAPVTLDPANLPGYALRTTLRMFAAMAASLLFTLAYAPLAARTRAGVVLLPLLDVLQSVPILGFLSFTVTAFVGLFPGSTLGYECAAVFAIFTSQAWNMTFSLHQSLRSVPGDLAEASRSFRLSAWQRFWRLDLPFAVPGLVWNAMMSMSGGWFFVVAAEAISVGAVTVKLPGIGSYVALAIERRDLGAVGWALLAMAVVILATDQVLFRPLVFWADRFRGAQPGDAPPRRVPWAVAMLRQGRLVPVLLAPLRAGAARVRGLDLALPVPVVRAVAAAFDRNVVLGRWLARASLAVLVAGAALVAALAVLRLSGTLGLADCADMLLRGLATLARVAVLTALASLLWVPVGVWIGMRPRLAARAQPLAQLLAAFPANLLFPAFVVVLLRFDLDPDIWLGPLMVLGTQWYILFNVIAGARALPADLAEAAASLRVRGWLWWRRVALPGILPYYLTGAITASGGCWNASVVAELVRWGDSHLQAYGLGAAIAEATLAGDGPRVALGIAVMALFVVAVNRLLWGWALDRMARRLGQG